MGMSLQTKNIGLGKWSDTDIIDPSDVNDNMDVVDRNILGINSIFTSKELSVTIEAAELQSFINSLPKILLHNITITVNSGTYGGDFEIYGFIGPGILTINGGELGEAMVVIDGNVSIIGNTNQQIEFVNFYITADTGDAFYIYQNSANVTLRRCASTQGSRETYSPVGINAVDNGGCIRVAVLSISNKYYAFRCARTRLFISGSTVSNCGTAYMAYEGADIRITSLIGIANTGAVSSISSGASIRGASSWL